MRENWPHLVDIEASLDARTRQQLLPFASAKICLEEEEGVDNTAPHAISDLGNTTHKLDLVERVMRMVHRQLANELRTENKQTRSSAQLGRKLQREGQRMRTHFVDCFAEQLFRLGNAVASVLRDEEEGSDGSQPIERIG